MADLEKIAEELSNLTVLEASELSKILEEKMGEFLLQRQLLLLLLLEVNLEEMLQKKKDSFTIVLTDVGDKKINVIKEVRTATGLGLKEAKELVESAPKDIKEDVPKDEANEIKEKLEAAGAKVDLK